MSYETYAQAKALKKNVMAVVEEKSEDGVKRMKWRKVPIKGLSEEEFLAWKSQWIGAIKSGFDRCFTEIVKDVKGKPGGYQALTKCIQLLNAKEKQEKAAKAVAGVK